MKKRNKVVFTYLDIYYFDRCLGKDKVPESGNNPLGMEICHFFLNRVDIHKKSSKFHETNGSCMMTSTPYAKNNEINFFETSSQSSNDMDSFQSVFSIDYTTKSLQPLNPRQRIKCLKDAGVEILKDQLSTDESKSLVKLRQERQQVGCKCTGSSPCDPSKCACSGEGIPCQSDNNIFPCKCGPKCANQYGKRVYSDLRIKYHYRHTLNNDLFTTQASTVTDDGDCRLCNEIHEDVLSEMFTVNVEPKRKRAASTRYTDASQLTKSKKTYFGSMESLAEGTETCPTTVYKNVLPTDKSGNKENTALQVRIKYPEKLKNVSPFCLEKNAHGGSSGYLMEEITSPDKLNSVLSPFEIHEPQLSSSFNDNLLNKSPFLLKSDTRDIIMNALVVGTKIEEKTADLSPMDSLISIEKESPKSIIDSIIEKKFEVKMSPISSLDEISTEKMIHLMQRIDPDIVIPASSPLKSFLSESWTNIDWNIDNDTSPIQSQNTYFWDSFLSDQADNVALLSPMAPLTTTLNPISLDTDVNSPHQRGTLTSIQHFTNTTVYNSLDQFRHRNCSNVRQCAGANRHLYLESPYQKTQSAKVNFRKSKRKKEIQISPKKQDEEIMLLPFVDIVGIDESGPTPDQNRNA